MNGGTHEARYTDHQQGIQIHARIQNNAGIPPRKVSADTKRVRAKDVVQTRKGYVRFIF
jgi:hypothetical protein